jgi:hypothetical protein
MSWLDGEPHPVPPFTDWLTCVSASSMRAKSSRLTPSR